MSRIPWNKGKHDIYSEETLKKMRDNHADFSGERNPMYGKRHTEETRKKLSTKKKNEKHPLWKGDDVSYTGLHLWIAKNKQKPDVCEMCCFYEPKHVANISGEYKRDVNDYQWLCPKCHGLYDSQIRR